jgi:hypothetical protein
MGKSQKRRVKERRRRALGDVPPPYDFSISESDEVVLELI